MFRWFCYDCGAHGTTETEMTARARLLNHYDNCTGPQYPKLADLMGQSPKVGA